MMKNKRVKGRFLNYTLMVIGMVWFVSSINQFQTTIDKEGVKRLEEALRKAAVTCYSVEGYYPAAVDYLTAHYGVFIDDEKYHVFYEVLGANIQPEIRVYQR